MNLFLFFIPNFSNKKRMKKNASFKEWNFHWCRILHVTNHKRGY